MNEDLVYLPAVEALSAFEEHRLSPVELVAAVIDQADRVETTVNALAHRFPEQAIEQARLAERRYVGKGDAPRALEGLPVAIKEETPVAGRPWTQGSLVYKDAVADFTAPVPERVMAAGGIVHALATAPEFSCAAWTNSRLHGVTRNPWNPDFSPGGSSGGWPPPGVGYEHAGHGLRHRRVESRSRPVSAGSWATSRRTAGSPPILHSTSITTTTKAPRVAASWTASCSRR